MMQVTVYNCRAFDEKALFLEYAEELGIELVLCADAPDLDNVSLCRGSRCVDVLCPHLSDAHTPHEQTEVLLLHPRDLSLLL